MSSSAGTPRTNRRLTARKACLLTVRYRTAKDWHPATCMDLSREGCRLRLGQCRLPQGLIARGKGAHREETAT